MATDNRVHRKVSGFPAPHDPASEQTHSWNLGGELDVVLYGDGCAEIEYNNEYGFTVSAAEFRAWVDAIVSALP